MNNEDKLFDLITKMYADLKGSQDKMYTDLKGSQDKMYADLKGGQEKMLEDIKDIQTRLNNVEKTVLNIENKHGEKLKALFDGYLQNSSKLERIEKEVTKHDEIILRRVNY